MQAKNADFSFEKLSHNMPGALLVYRADEEAEILCASEGLVDLFECDSFEDLMKFTGGSFSGLVYPEDIEETNKIIEEQIKLTNGFDYVKYRIITKTGKIKHIEDWGHFVHDEELGDLYYVNVHDISYKEKLMAIAGNNIMTMQATGNTTDELTGLFNMAYFRLHASEYITRLLQSDGQANCIYFNVRNFHTYNETYGFSGGDRMLQSIARILKDTFPKGLIARVEGDHFVVLTSQSDLSEKIIRMSNRINNIRRGVVVEMKAGVFKIRDDKMDVGLICDYAQLSCDSIKREYGSIVQFYDGKMDERIHMQDHILSSFDHALTSGHIKIFFQPVVDVASGEIASYEALTRWEDPSYGSITPANFISILEEQHQIHKLDSFVIESVCKDLQRRRDSGEKLIPVSINLSRLDFELTDIIKVIEDAVKHYNIPRDLLRFEITESLIAMDMEAMKKESERLRQNGFKVWMDAFGSGYSSLKVLKDFVIDGLKIDMDMIKSFDNERTNIILSAVIDMARRLGIPALSKGVETPEQLDFVKKAGCDLAQGYLLGKPEPADKQ